MVFLFDISRLRSLAIDQWVVCTHILKEPWNLFKKIANRQYHIHIIQHLWYLRNKNQVRFMLNNLLQRLQTWQPTLGHFWKDSLHFRLKMSSSTPPKKGLQPLQLYELLSYLKLPMVIWVWSKNTIVFGCCTNPAEKYVQVKLDHLPPKYSGWKKQIFQTTT